MECFSFAFGSEAHQSVHSLGGPAEDELSGAGSASWHFQPILEAIRYSPGRIRTQNLNAWIRRVSVGRRVTPEDSAKLSKALCCPGAGRMRYSWSQVAHVTDPS